MKDREILGLIPARGGSKSIPRKNLLLIGGKPLIAWSISIAKQVRSIDRIIVSTDDEEIADVAVRYGAEVPFIRPAKYATDEATDFDVFDHALNWLRENEAYNPELVAHLRPTHPARQADTIQQAINTLLQADQKVTALRSVSVATQSPYKMWRRDADRIVPVVSVQGVKEAHSIARQALPIAYWQNGYIDVVRSSTVTEMNSMVGDHVLPFVINETVVDLDYLSDVCIVEKALLSIIEGNSTTIRNGDEKRVPV